MSSDEELKRLMFLKRCNVQKTRYFLLDVTGKPNFV